MEELRSTEILAKEIKEDARKKAERILKNADAEAQNILSGISSRIQKVKKEKQSLYSEKIAAYKADCEAAVPLEKLRKRISFFDTEIKKALDTYFEKIGEDKRLAIISALLGSFTDSVRGCPLKIKYAGYPKAKIEKIVSAHFKDSKIEEYKALSSAEAEIAGLKDGVFAEEADGSFVCKASLDEVKDRLLTEKRAELKAALFGDLE